jgi:hypothetical protein
MLVTFVRSQTGSTLATIRRRDGVVVELPGFDKKHRVPHDLAHLATERHLGLSGGVFGSIAGGGMFSNMRVVDGRPRHDAAVRSRRVLAANKRELGLAEVMAGAVHDAVEHGRAQEAPVEARRIWASLGTGPFPWTDQQVTDATRSLMEWAADYRRDGTVSVQWPDGLSSSSAPIRAGAGRGRQGRR